MGDKSLWDKDPFSGIIQNNILHGRGAADSKIAVSMFMHLAAEFQKCNANMKGNLQLIFDADEHTGRFGGIKTALKEMPKPDGVIIGYPGLKALNIGARGFSRYIIHLNKPVYWEEDSFHSSIVDVGTHLYKILQEKGGEEKLQAYYSEAFGNSPKLTVTSIDLVAGNASGHLMIDVRLVPGFEEEQADVLIDEALDKCDKKDLRIICKKHSSEPPYRIDDDHLLRRAFRKARSELNFPELYEKECSPSNKGCYLKRQEITATCGYGVDYEGLHGDNEKAFLDKLPEVYDTHKTAVEYLLGMR